MSELSSVIKNLKELQQMHQLNLEMLEQLGVVFHWIIENNIPIPNEQKFSSLLAKCQALLKEICSNETTKILQYKKLTDELSQKKLTDDNFAEPESHQPLFYRPSLKKRLLAKQRREIKEKSVLRLSDSCYY